MKRLFFLFSFMIIINILSAQEAENINRLDIKSSDYQTLDKVIYRFIYKQLSTSDVSSPQKKKENIMYLQVGKNISKYFDQQRFFTDSLRNIHIKQKKSAEESSKIIVPLLRGSIAENVFKNFPENKITITDRIPFNTYQYEEDFVSPDWKLVGESCTLCGYECKKALTTVSRTELYSLVRAGNSH